MTNMLRQEWRKSEGFRIVILMASVQVITAVGLIVVLLLSLAHLNDVTIAREEAARDSCQLLVGLVDAATTHAPRQKKAARAYIERTVLRDCNLYARTIIQGNPVITGHRR